MRRGSTTDRNALAEIRQSYLLRQPINGTHYKTTKNPFNIKPDYYDYRNLNYYSSGRGTLPYYVVPVLYVPQKVLSTEDIEQTRPDWLPNSKENLLQSDTEEYENQDEVNASGDDLEVDLGSKSSSFIQQTNSESTLNEQLSISSPYEEVSDTLKTNHFDNGFSPNIYKYSPKQDDFRNETFFSVTNKFHLQPQQKEIDYNINVYHKNPFKNQEVFYKYKNPYTLFNKYPITSKENKNNPPEEGLESKSNHLDLPSNGLKEKKKICIDCLKDKYFIKDLECRKKVSKNLQTNRGFNESGFVKSASTQSSIKAVESDSKSTQTSSATKINFGTQTERQTINKGSEFEQKGTTKKVKASQIPQRTNSCKLYNEYVKQRNEKSSCNNNSKEIKKSMEGM